MASPSRSIARLAVATLVVNLFVVLWGAWVRASGSGAGCGNHWPTCNGVIIPSSPTMHTIVEFTHRLSSGLALIMVVLLVVATRRALPRGHWSRRAAVAAVVLILVEAGIGAGLVKFDLVAGNATVTRAFTLGIHLVNTQFLLSAIALTGWWSSAPLGTAVHDPDAHARWFVLAFVALIVVGFAGVFASLGDTLFPAQSLAAGLAQDRNPAVNVLLHIRIWHPALAFLTGAGLLVLAGNGVHWRDTPNLRRSARFLAAAVILQWSIGVVSLILLVPVPLQLLHLLIADVVWLATVWLAAELFAPQSLRTTPTTSRAASASNTVPAPSSR